MKYQEKLNKSRISIVLKFSLSFQFFQLGNRNQLNNKVTLRVSKRKKIIFVDLILSYNLTTDEFIFYCYLKSILTRYIF